MVSAEADQESDTRDAKENKIESFMLSGDDRHYHDQKSSKTFETDRHTWRRRVREESLPLLIRSKDQSGFKATRKPKPGTVREAGIVRMTGPFGASFS